MLVVPVFVEETKFECLVLLKGDEGDPLVVDAAGDPVLVGIHSLHSGCTRGEPSVHVNVFYYRDWIKEKTGI
jgi:secreted trypsin-like serine protease